MAAHAASSVTAIVYSFNYGRLVHQALESLAGQTVRPDRLIVVDDASHDSSRAVIESFLGLRGNRFAHSDFLRNGTHAGKLACLNKAVPMIDTGYAIVLDADDFLPAQAIGSLLAGFPATSDDGAAVGFVYSDCHLVDLDGEIVGRGRSDEWSPELLAARSYIPGCALTLSAALKAAAPFDETVRVDTKHHKWTRIAQAGWIGRYLPEPLFCYRMHERNVAGGGRKDRLLADDRRAAETTGILPD